MPKTMADIPEFLAGEKLAALCTVDSSGSPHVVPAFFTYEDGKLYIQAGKNSLKAEHVRLNGRAAVAVYRGDGAVILRGSGRIVESESDFMHHTDRHIEKYAVELDDNGRDSFGIPLYDFGARCIIEVTPTRWLYW
jgi:general stress protein 26